jgi:streptogramin lyase
VARLDPTTGRVKAVVKVGVDPLLLVVAAGRVWTMQFGDGTLTMIDPETNEAAAVRVGEAAGIASDGDDIWVAANGNTLVRLDGESGKRERVLKLARKSLFELRDAGFLTVSSESIWLTIPLLGEPLADQTLWRIDPRTGAVKARAPLLANPVSIANDARYVWVANIDGGKITRVDKATNTAKHIDASVGPAGVAIDAGSVLGHALRAGGVADQPRHDTCAGEDPSRHKYDTQHRLRGRESVGDNRIGGVGARPGDEQGRADDRPDRAETGDRADRRGLPRRRPVGLDRMNPMTSTGSVIGWLRRS